MFCSVAPNVLLCVAFGYGDNHPIVIGLNQIRQTGCHVVVTELPHELCSW